jgi:hypothetical protein
MVPQREGTMKRIVAFCLLLCARVLRHSKQSYSHIKNRKRFEPQFEEVLFLTEQWSH